MLHGVTFIIILWRGFKDIIKYENLTINQKINIKEIIYSKKLRNQLGISDCYYFEMLHLLALINKNYLESSVLLLNKFS